MIAVDLFAGLGGFTQGAKKAGYRVVWAANHWRDACEAHSRNHPDTTIACQDLHQVNFEAVPDHDVGCFSPCCHGHCWARGKERPHHDDSRATAWAVVSCAEIKRPEFLVIENVPQFLNWQLFPAWESALKCLGFTLSPHLIDSADLGIPQHRRRMFIIGTRSSSQIRLRLPKMPWVPASEIIGSDPCSSPVTKKCASTQSRVIRGRENFGSRFLVAYYGSAKGGRSIDRPLGTVTTRDRFGLVDGDFMRMLSVGEYRRAMGFPDSYWLPSNRALAIHLLGNAVVPPVATAVLSALKEQA